MIQVANAPCSWGVLEFDGVAAPSDYATVLDEIRDTGYAGTELGDWGFMPTAPARLKAEIKARGLELVGAFVPVAFANPGAHDAGAATAIRTATLMRDAGFSGAFIVLADDNASVAMREQNAGRIRPEHRLSDEAWMTFAAGVDKVANAVAQETGLRTVFHPHCGGYVETPDEIDRLMELTDRTRVGLVLDSGHIIYGGGDPLTVLNTHRPRVWHVHFKDCDLNVAKSARQKRLGYLEAVRAQLFCELGTGVVDFASIAGALKSSGYGGWIVVEQDVFPGYGSPKASAQRSREFLRGLGL
ncbi:MAG TPA: sugar phosphate isomerase/epimerase [Vicinamibacterales bacterium]|nr:sugar phosphate isomerase/epimerase [Vicinamibacterales bacterium]